MTESCFKCGNTGKLINGESCTCKYSLGELPTNMSNASVDFIPKEYIGLTFSEAFVQPTQGNYAEYMQQLYTRICREADLQSNLFISSPSKRSKQVFVYSAIQYLAKRNIPVFPYIDIGEVGRYIRDIDHGKCPKHLKDHSIEPDLMYACPVLFVKATMSPSSETLIHLATLVDRRVRQGHYTVIFSHQKWQGFTTNDIYSSFRSLEGDGLFGTIKVKEWGYVERAEA